MPHSYNPALGLTEVVGTPISHIVTGRWRLAAHGVHERKEIRIERLISDRGRRFHFFSLG
jgi:hypothetical protein